METKVEELKTGAREFDISIYHGDITVTATEGDTWRFEWSCERDKDPVLEREGDIIRIRQPGEPNNPPRLNLRLSIPSTTEIVGIRTGNGRITSEGVRGQLRLQSGNGDLTLRGGRGDIALHTANGQITIFDMGGKLQAQSGNGTILLQDATGEAMLTTNAGRIEVTVPRALSLSAESGHGDIQIGDGPVEHVHAHTRAGNVHCSAELGDGEHHLESGHGDIHVRAARGNVQLRTAAGRIAVADTRGSLHAETGHGDVVLQAAASEVHLSTSAGRIEIKAPRELHVRAHSGNGDIHIGDGSVQTLEVETKRGNIHCAATLAGATHTATNGHGDVMLRSVRGELHLKTSAGRIELADVQGSVQAQTGSGDILLRTAMGDADLQTSHGKVEVQTPRRLDLRAHTGHGDIQVGDGSVGSLQLQSNVGRVQCVADLGPGRHELTSGNGDILLRLRPDARAHLDAQTSFGQIHSDFSLVRVGRSGSMSFNGTRMVGGLGATEPDINVTLRTSRGQIELRRKEGVSPRYEPLPVARPREEPREQPEPQIAAVQERAPEHVLTVLRALAEGNLSLEEADSLL